MTQFRSKKNGSHYPLKSGKPFYPGAKSGKKIEILHKETYGKDHSFHLVSSNDPEFMRKHGGYRHIITYGAISHTAFQTDAGLKRFLSMTGLKESPDKYSSLSKEGKIKTYRLDGVYTKISMAGNRKNFNDFGKKQGLTPSKILDNGDYTKAFYKDGKIYYLNPNYDREILPYVHE